MAEHAGTGPWQWQRPAQVGDTSILLLGDTNIQDRADPASAFAHVLGTLQDADVLFGQLEGPLSPPSQDPDAPDIAHKDRWRHSDPRMVEALVAAGFDAVACASNVCFPPTAALNSIATLDEAGIKHCGAGATIDAARAPAIVEADGATVGFLSYTSVFWPVGHAAGPTTPGCATIKVHTGYQPDRRALEMPAAPPIILTVPDPAELAAMEADVRALRRQADIVIVSCHWGVSSSVEVVDYQRVVGRAAIEAGADLVFGHHPHVIQGVECHHGRPVFYSLGNFAFDWPKMAGRNLDGLMVRLLVRDRQVADLAVLPVRRDADNLIAILDPASDGRAVIDSLATRSAPFGTEIIARDRDAAVAGARSA